MLKTVILAGGFGTRLSEETATRPKPMVEIGGRPILWHIMSLYAKSGFREFVVACGYKGEIIKGYFQQFAATHSDWVIDLSNGSCTTYGEPPPDWRVHCIDTGYQSLTGGRLLRLRPLLEDATFLCTYGDGLSDVPIADVLAFHRRHGCLATVTATHPPARFGQLELDGDRVRRFSEKPQTGQDWINGGFFIFEPGIFDYIEGDQVSLERDVLDRVAAAGQLKAYLHHGYFQPMDTLRDKMMLEELWASGMAPWAVP